MPLTLSEILSNEKVVVFSYGEDTITITYKPYAIRGKEREHIIKLAKRAELVRPKQPLARLVWHARRISKLKVYHLFLQTVLVRWDISENGKELSIAEGLERLPALFIERLYYSMAAEIVTVARETSAEPIKKK